MTKKIGVLIFISTAILVQINLTQLLAYGGNLEQQQRCRTFAETKRVVCGKFLLFWERNGGLPIFGYPISNELTEVLEIDTDPGSFTVQYFERAIFQLHYDKEPPYDVQLAHLGLFKYRASYSGGNFEGDMPIYPNATVLDVDLGVTTEVRITTLATQDSPEAVRSFYKEFLLKRGWQITHETPATIHFSYSRVPGIERVIYDFYVDTDLTSGGQKRVKLYFIYRPDR
ncbi:MAG TPA: hypothetical protein VF826_05385 [Chloroflexia bacterium]